MVVVAKRMRKRFTGHSAKPIGACAGGLFSHRQTHFCARRSTLSGGAGAYLDLQGQLASFNGFLDFNHRHGAREAGNIQFTLSNLLFAAASFLLANDGGSR